METSSKNEKRMRIGKQVTSCDLQTIATLTLALNIHCRSKFGKEIEIVLPTFQRAWIMLSIGKENLRSTL